MQEIWAKQFTLANGKPTARAMNTKRQPKANNKFQIGNNLIKRHPGLLKSPPQRTQNIVVDMAEKASISTVAKSQRW